MAVGFPFLDLNERYERYEILHAENVSCGFIQLLLYGISGVRV